MKKSPSRLLSVATLVLAFSSVHAADITKSATGTDLADGASWGGTAPGAADTAVWGTGSLGGALSLGASASWGGIRATSATADVVTGGAGALTLGGGGILVSGVNFTMGNDVVLSGNQSWRAATGRTLLVEGDVSGSGDLLIGSAAPTQTSTTFLTTTDQTIFPGLNLADVTGASGLMGGGFVNSGTPLAASAYQFTNNGTTATYWLKILDGGFTKGLKVQLTQSGADVRARSLSAKFISGSNLAVDFETTGNTGTIATSQAAGGYGGHTTTLTIGTAPAGQVSLSGNNTYSGTTGVVSGTLVVSGGAAIPNGSAVTLGAGGSLQLAGSETIGSLAGAGGVALGAHTLTLGANNTSTGFTGGISGTGALVKTGTGTQTLGGVGTYGGGAILSQGTMVANIGSAFGTGGIQINNAATGANQTALYLQTVATGDIFLTVPVTVANQGSGTTILGTSRSGAGRSFFDGLITLNKDVVLSGTLTDRTQYRGGITGSGNITINGGSRTTFSDTTSTTEGGEGTAPFDFSGNLTLAGTNTILQFNSDIELTNVGTVTVGAGATLRPAYGKTVRIGGLSGSGTVTSVAGSGTLVVGLGGATSSFSGVISGTGGDALNFTKQGAGIQTLTGACTYSGATTISGGTLKIGTGGSINATTSIAIAPGAALDVTDTGYTLATGRTLVGGDANPAPDVLGALVSQGTVRPGGPLALGTISGITNLTLGGTLDWDRSANSTDSDSISINGTLAISPGFTINVSTLGFPSAGTRSYTVVSGLTTPLTAGDIANLPVLPADFAWDTSDPAALRITHVQVGANLTWTGAIDGNWDTATANWSGVPGIFQPGDFCTLDDTATGGTLLDVLATDVSPGGLLVNNSTLAYTIESSFGGAGIAGTTSLLKQGTGTLTLTSLNTYSGGTVITGGILAFGDNALPSAGGIRMDGGTLRWHEVNTQDISPALIFQAGKTATFDTNGNTVVFGSGIGSSVAAPLVKDGSGSLVLSGAGTWSGGVEVRAGILQANAAAAFGSNTITVGTGTADASVMLGNRSDILNPIVVSASGSGNVSIGADTTGPALNAATYAGTVTLNRPTTLLGLVADDRVAFDGRITGNVGTLTIAGGSRVTLASTLNDFVGNIVITGAGSVLQSSVATAPGVIPDASNITIDQGAVYQLASTTGSEVVGGLFGQGTVRPYFAPLAPTQIFGLSVTFGGADADGDFSGVFTNGNGELGFVKTGAGTQVLRGFNSNTGNMVVENGTLHLAESAALRFRVTNAATNTLTGAGTIVLDGNFAIDVSAVTVTSGTWQLENASSLAGAYGSTFTVVTPAGIPWTDAGSNTWEYSSGGLVFTFDETTGTLTVEQGGFASWIASAEFGLAAGDQDPGDDPDGDGLSNLVEYAIAGLNPAVGNSLAGTFDGQTLAFSKRAEAAADAGLSILIQVSDDLGTGDPWTEAPAGPGYVNNASVVSFQLPPGADASFARLAVFLLP